MSEHKGGPRPNRSCYCSWIECDEIKARIKKYAPSHHLWNQDIIRIRFTQTKTGDYTDSKRAFLNSMDKHLCDGKGNTIDVPANIFVRAFHFPLSLLHWRAKNPTIGFSTPLSSDQAKLIRRLSPCALAAQGTRASWAR